MSQMAVEELKERLRTAPAGLEVVEGPAGLHNVVGGTTAWANAGYPVERG